jgi:hypothetical protein
LAFQLMELIPLLDIFCDEISHILFYIYHVTVTAATWMTLRVIIVLIYRVWEGLHIVNFKVRTNFLSCIESAVAYLTAIG